MDRSFLEQKKQEQSSKINFRFKTKDYVAVLNLQWKNLQRKW